jgi:hypothetical protein
MAEKDVVVVVVLHKQLHPSHLADPLACLPLAPLPTAPVITVPPDEKCRAAAGRAPSSNGRVQGRRCLGGKWAIACTTGHGPLGTRARNRRSAWEGLGRRVTLSSDLRGPRRRRQRQTGRPQQALQSHLADLDGHGHGHGVAEGCVDGGRQASAARCCCCRRCWLAGGPVRPPAPGIQGLAFSSHTLSLNLEGSHREGELCVCQCACACVCVCVCVCRAHKTATSMIHPLLSLQGLVLGRPAGQRASHPSSHAERNPLPLPLPLQGKQHNILKNQKW